ncbi:Hypothetical_protein [Hexamita inflata]|uniref:Hypothetical_protein n=1 Tax=Hexamita inflata TaxID=28002 RepID=A0AA86QT03_9EUKA|nr:Hypothetical protein HINF_LOCUS53151 [Hexamita inflata]
MLFITLPFIFKQSTERTDSEYKQAQIPPEKDFESFVLVTYLQISVYKRLKKELMEAQPQSPPEQAPVSCPTTKTAQNALLKSDKLLAVLQPQTPPTLAVPLTQADISFESEIITALQCTQGTSPPNLSTEILTFSNEEPKNVTLEPTTLENNPPYEPLSQTDNSENIAPLHETEEKCAFPAKAAEYE